MQPGVVADAERVLRAAGAAPERVRGATCCGQPAWNSGFVTDARRVARRTLRALAGSDAVVVPAGSCAAMMRLHWPHLFRGEPDEAAAARVAAATHELTQCLVDVLGWRPPGGGERPAVTYHDSCHMLRELRVREQPRLLLAAVADLHELPRGERCCGFGGTFSVRYPDVSTAMADDKLASARASGATTLVSADPGCLMQLDGRASRLGAPVRVRHIATVLAEAAG
jgi:L-lactate dehydrogenase complex protein LldE